MTINVLFAARSERWETSAQSLLSAFKRTWLAIPVCVSHLRAWLIPG